LTSNFFGGKNFDLTSDDTEELRVFLRDHVSGFEELEILLFFVRSERRPWSAAELRAALNLSQELIRAALAQLVTAAAPITGDTAGTYRYTPDSRSERLLEVLRRAYDEERLTILQLMSSNALERVRRAAALRLANAFRLKASKK